MPTFLDNSLGYLNNGWQQMYGQPAVGASPATPVSSPPPAQATPVLVNPNVAGSPDMPQMLPVLQLLSAGGNNNPAPVAYNPEVGAPLGAGPTPMARNPEVGQPAGTGGFWGWLQNMFSGGNQAPQMNSPGLPTNIGIAQPGSDYESSLSGMGPAGQWPTGSTVSPGNYVLGPSVDGQAGQILATGSDATATPGGGGGGMSGGQMGSSILSGIGSGISQIGKGIASAQTKFEPPNIPLPQRATFTPPALSPNTKASF